jgi:hypothetical protein
MQLAGLARTLFRQFGTFSVEQVDYAPVELVFGNTAAGIYRDEKIALLSMFRTLKNLPSFPRPMLVLLLVPLSPFKTWRSLPKVSGAAGTEHSI